MLQKQDMYMLHASLIVTCRLKRNRVVAWAIDDEWEADLIIIMDWLGEQNNYKVHFN
jgi:hypothetical protein